MASSGKKGKKSKGKTLALNDFLQETPGPAPSIPIRKSGLNWAEEVEDAYVVSENYDTRAKQQVVLPTAPKAARGIDDYSDKIPNQPPYIAYLSNLPYDVDEDEIANFFCNLKIVNMRIPKDDRPGETPKLRGFGYVEFEDRDSLLCALAIPDCTLKNRRIRIEVATNSENERRRGGRMDSNRDRSDRPDTSSGDWRSEGRVGGDSMDNNDKRFNRDRDRDREAPIERGWRDGDRPNFRENNRDNDRSRFDRGFGSSRRNDREDRNGGMSRNRDETQTERPEPRTRPKLNLAPRTKPIENTAAPAAAVENTTEPSKPSNVSAASIFGNAKPVDTTAKEREIEERLAKEQEKKVEVNSEKKDIKKEEDKFKKDEVVRRSSRSPERKYSPRRISPYRSKYSPDRNRSNDRRRVSPDRRRLSPDKRRASPEKRRVSPDRRRPSPDRRRGSPERRRISPDRKRASPERKRVSPDRKRASPDRRRGASPDRRRISPDKRRVVSPDRRRASPDRRRASPEKNRGAPIRRIDDRKVPPRGDRISQRDKVEKTDKKREEKPLRDFTDRDMPKLKQPEPQNFVTSNQYAYLDTEDNSE